MATSSVPRVVPRHWVYLDERKTHEVHAEVEARADEATLITTEFAAGSREPAEALQTARRVTQDAEVRAALDELEQRLRLSGTYYRLDFAEMKWAPLGPAPAAARLDLRAIELPMPGAAQPGAKMGFHHFHNPGGDDRLLITMPRADLGGDRHVLAELSFEFPQVDAGDLQVRHTRLTPPVLRSSLVQHHVEMPKQGYAKLVEAKDYLAAYGEGWVASARLMWRNAATRLLRDPPRREAVAGFVGKPAPAKSRLDQVADALLDAKVLALKARFVDGPEIDRALAGGEHAIRRLVQTKRRQFDHTMAYDISMLESALLLEHAVKKESWSLLEEEADKMLRFVRGYHKR